MGLFSIRNVRSTWGSGFGGWAIESPASSTGERLGFHFRRRTVGGSNLPGFRPFAGESGDRLRGSDVCQPCPGWSSCRECCETVTTPRMWIEPSASGGATGRHGCFSSREVGERLVGSGVVTSWFTVCHPTTSHHPTISGVAMMRNGITCWRDFGGSMRVSERPVFECDSLRKTGFTAGSRYTVDRPTQHCRNRRPFSEIPLSCQKP